METLARLIIRYPKLNILIIIVITVILGCRIIHIKMETALESFHIRNDADISFATEFQNVFGSDDIIVIGIAGFEMLGRPTLQKIERITGRLEALPGLLLAALRRRLVSDAGG